MAINLMSTLRGSLLENFFPQGWDLNKLDSLCARAPETIVKPERWWNKRFQPIPCNTLEDFDTMMGHEIALEILNAKANKKQIAFILPVGPMGMYRWAVYFLKEWNCDCRHVHGFIRTGRRCPPGIAARFRMRWSRRFTDRSAS